MGRCDILSLAASNACSGKCRDVPCGGTYRTWVVAACGGKISLFEKDDGGHLSLLSQEGSVILPSLESFSRVVERAAREMKFDQLVIVGSANDIAWTQISLPRSVAKSVTAEIEYPLVDAWFKQNGDAHALAHALEHLLHS